MGGTPRAGAYASCGGFLAAGGESLAADGVAGGFELDQRMGSLEEFRAAWALTGKAAAGF